MKSIFEQNGGTYSIVNGYRIPNLIMKDEPEYNIGIWGRQRLDYLKNHRKSFYTILLTSGKLAKHLYQIDVIAFERQELIIKQMMEALGITEELKSKSQMTWVRAMNNIKACADEIIRSELIYD